MTLANVQNVKIFLLHPFPEHFFLTSHTFYSISEQSKQLQNHATPQWKDDNISFKMRGGFCMTLGSFTIVKSVPVIVLILTKKNANQCTKLFENFIL